MKIENSKQPTYYNEPDTILNPTMCDVLERVKRELAGKQYFDDDTYRMYIEENGLNPNDTYVKDTMQRGMLQAVYDILSSLTGDIDLYRRVDTEFGTTGDAMKHLETRLYNLQKRIFAIPDEPNEDNRKSSISFLFVD